MYNGYDYNKEIILETRRRQKMERKTGTVSDKAWRSDSYGSSAGCAYSSMSSIFESYNEYKISEQYY